MSFDWHDYHHLAQQLLNGAPSSSHDESLFRSAISRAYYGSFCLARNFLRSSEPDFDDQKSGVNPHVLVHDWLQSKPDPDLKEAATQLSSLRIYRNKADYDDEYEGSLSREAILAIRMANDIIGVIDNERENLE